MRISFFRGNLTIGVIHYNAELASLRFVSFTEADNVRMANHLENFSLSISSLFLFFAHFLNVDLFDHGERLIPLTLNKKGLSKGTFA